jgi:cytochrome b subunit of formate dehydrogenase
VSREFRAIIFSLPVLGLLLFSQPLRAQPPPDEVCLSCHGAEGLEKERGGKKISLRVDGQTFASSIHAPFGCATCHSDASGVPHPPALKRVECAPCHADASQAYLQSVHGKARARGFTEAANCVSCHGSIHEMVRRTEPSSPIHPANIAKSCAACHANAALAEKFRIPVVRPVEAYLQSVHARAVAAGKPGAVCSDCHGSHAVAPAKDPSSRIAPANIAATCGKCHGDVAKLYQESIHGQAHARGVRSAPVCTDCHGEHRILARTEPKSPVFGANIPGETCGRCHGDTRLSERMGLSPDKVPSFQDSFHGLALRAGQLTAANCASCHGVHDIRPSSDPRSHIHSANLPETCGKCHPGAGTRFALGPVHVLSTTTYSVLFWIRIIYLWVIGLTVGLMIVHNGLDLMHKSRDRSEPRPFAASGELHERMPRSLRWQHGLAMMTFPLLAYTGFALTYPESWWASPLLQWEASLGLRGYLHRAAAAVLMGSLLWHLVELAASQERRDRLRKQTLGWKDLRDLWRMMRYNAGLGLEKPRFGEFNYAEKIEYWAFLWGMIVMSATGLLLWFENLSLSYLPKLATDIATAIHFYEAVLATLAILVWHLYWVIFDPHIYPMDTAWWHGRSPAARVSERSGTVGEAGAGTMRENSPQSSGPAPEKKNPLDRDGD